MIKIFITFVILTGITMKIVLGDELECSVQQNVIVKCIEVLPENTEIDFQQVRKTIDRPESIYELDSLLDLCSGPDKETITPNEIISCTEKSCFVRDWMFEHFCQLVMESPIN
jgi:hypothetical protein|tara:strand:+ start:95 stop:433 length:339 start_codon:yes stop_codon:yes gene_type:complete